VNTFQAVVALTDAGTYVMFLYSELQWYRPNTESGSASGGSAGSGGSAAGQPST